MKHRPQTSKYRNQSHICFGDYNHGSNQNCADAKEPIKRRRPQSYKNVSKIAQFMNDTIQPVRQKQFVSYVNVIQNLNQRYEVPKTDKLYQSKSNQFSVFLQKSGNKIYKPVDEFTDYADLMKKNKNLLRRGQFNLPLERQSNSMSKLTQNQKKSNVTLKYYSKFTQSSKYSKSRNNFKLANTISATLKESNKQKKHIEKQKEDFNYYTQKHIKPFNKTFLGYANEYEKLRNKQRYEKDRINLNNSMNRVLTMETMGKQIENLTQLYI